MRVKLRELGDIYTGNTPSKNNDSYWDTKDIGFVKPDILYEDKIATIFETEEYISEKARNKARIVDEGSILVTCIGIIGKIGISTKEVAFNQQINAIKPNKDILPKYLAYALLANRNRLRAVANAPVVPIINKTNFGEFEINIDIDEKNQKDIIDVLDRITHIINLKQKQLDLLDTLIKSRFVEMFGDPWCDSKYQNVLFSNCILSSLRGPFGSAMKKSLYVEKGPDTFKVYIQINAIKKDETLGDYYISKKYFDEKMKNFELFPDEYIITCDGTLGKTLKMSKNMERGVISSSLLKLRLNYNVITDEYFECLWNLYLLPILVKESRNACLIHLPSMKVIGKKYIPLPPLDLQNEFADFVQSVDKLKYSIFIMINMLK